MGHSLKFCAGLIAMFVTAATLAPVATARTQGAAKPGDGGFRKLTAWKDIAGRSYSAADVSRSKASVFIFVSTQCPIANLYTPRLKELGDGYSTRGVRFFLVDSNVEDSPTALRRYAQERRFPFPVVKDQGTALADRLGAAATPEAVILDSRGTVRYRGRIDDNQDRSKVIREDVREALDALLTGKPIARPRTIAFGCAIFRGSPRLATISGTVTYAKDVAPILYAKCLACHRAGEVGPFALETYQQAKVWSAAIKDYTARRIMPPWKAVPGHGDFAGARTLSDREIATLAKWLDAGAPQGDPKAMPVRPKFEPSAEWKLGTPDLVLRPIRAYHLDAEGKDVYREYVLPIDLMHDRYLQGVELKPDNRAIVHHMIAYLDETGKAAAMDGKESEPGYTVSGASIGVPNAKFIQGWAPGNETRFLPTGTAYKLAKGASLVLQVHYHKDGKVESDRSAIGLYYAKGPVEREMRVWAAANAGFTLEVGNPSAKVTADFTLPYAIHVYAASPHMHMLGREMKMTAELPDGTRREMIWINDWDFNWQESYLYKEPMALPRGAKIHVEAIYDNSEGNPRQTSQPPRQVGYGEQTSDEMCIGFFTCTVDLEHLDITPDQLTRGF